MADRGLGPQGVASFGSGTVDPAASNNRRKALLQMLMQKAGDAGAPGLVRAFGGMGTQRGGVGAVGATPVRGGQTRGAGAAMAAVTKPAQIAAQFVGGLGVGSRAGANDQGSQGLAVGRFLPTDGGPVQRHVATPGTPPPYAGGPVGGHGNIPQGVDGIDPETGAIDPTSVYAQGDVAPLGMSPIDVSPGSQTDPLFGSPSTPTSGASSMIPLGNGTYYDPATGTVHFPNTRTRAQ